MRIETVDNLLSKEDRKAILNSTVHDLLYHIATSNVTSPRWNFLSGHIDFYKTDAFDPLIKAVLDLPQVKGGETDILRMYSNMAPRGNYYGGDFHQDDGDITVLYYPHSWDTSWGGGTSFSIGETVDYVKNRVILFDSKIPHKADAHTFHGWRYSIVMKTTLKWAD